MLRHRCHILRLVETTNDGSPVHSWETVTETAIRCFLDLNFIRKGKDPIWTQEAGRPQDRSGVWFALNDAPIKSGDRIKMVKGPTGTFKVEGALDEAWRPTDLHHLEIGVQEVPPPRARFTGGGSDG